LLRFANLAGLAALDSYLPDADLSLLEPAGYKDFAGLAALITTAPAADLSRYGNFAGAAALESVTPAADLLRFANLAGLAALDSYLPDAELRLSGGEFMLGGDNLRPERPIPTGKYADAFRYFGVNTVQS
jgi:hypothetical protein